MLTCMPFGRESLARPGRLSCLPLPPSACRGIRSRRVRRRRENGSCQHTADADLRRWWTMRQPDRRCAGASWMAGALFRHELTYRRTGVPPARDHPRPASAWPRDRQPLAHPPAQDVPLHGSAAPGRVAPQHRDTERCRRRRDHLRLGTRRLPLGSGGPHRGRRRRPLPFHIATDLPRTSRGRHVGDRPLRSATFDECRRRGRRLRPAT